MPVHALSKRRPVNRVAINRGGPKLHAYHSHVPFPEVVAPIAVNSHPSMKGFVGVLRFTPVLP
jgi:hypothetical protein